MKFLLYALLALSEVKADLAAFTATCEADYEAILDPLGDDSNTGTPYMKAGCSCAGATASAANLACGANLFCSITSTPAAINENKEWAAAPNSYYTEWYIAKWEKVCVPTDYCDRADPWPLFVDVNWADTESIQRSQEFYYHACHGDVYNALNGDWISTAIVGAWEAFVGTCAAVYWGVVDWVVVVAGDLDI